MSRFLCIHSFPLYLKCRSSGEALNLQDSKMTDKSAIDKNAEHVVLMFKNHRTKLINVHDL